MPEACHAQSFTSLFLAEALETYKVSSERKMSCVEELSDLEICLSVCLSIIDVYLLKLFVQNKQVCIH